VANLRESNPRYLREWHPHLNDKLSPSDLAFKSNKKVWWQCSLRHDFLMSPYKRSVGQGCPKCGLVTRAKSAAVNRLSKRGSLAKHYPEVSKWWDTQKNEGVQPSDITSSSAKKFWWQCEKGHSYSASPGNRIRGKGCPICGIVRARVKFTETIVKQRGSLYSNHPELMESWDQERNGNLDPCRVPARGDTIVWWKCSRGHSWATQVKQRTVMATGCPHCRPNTSRLEIRIYTELKALFPKTNWRIKVKGFEADVICPELGVAVEIDGYPWHKGRENFEALKRKSFREQGLLMIQVRDKRLKLTEGPVVSYSEGEDNYRIVSKLMVLALELTEIDSFARNKVSEWLALGAFIGEEAYNKVLSYLPGPSPDDSFGSMFAELSKEWDEEKNFPLTPYLFHPKSNQKVWWRCISGHSYQMSMNKRSIKRGCPYCTGRRVNSSNSLASLKPKLSKHWNTQLNAPLTPNDVTVSSNRKAWWTCDNGHTWQALICKRKDDIRTSDCRKCSSLMFRFPLIAKQLALDLNPGIEPQLLAAHSNKKVWWRCSHGHEWRTSVNSRTGSHGTGCPLCWADRRVCRVTKK